MEDELFRKPLTDQRISREGEESRRIPSQETCCSCRRNAFGGEVILQGQGSFLFLAAKVSVILCNIWQTQVCLLLCLFSVLFSMTGFLPEVYSVKTVKKNIR